MLKERLDPCATLLYHWIRCHEDAIAATDLNLEHFQVWTAEFLEQAASIKEVDQALLRLMQLQLIRVEPQGIRTVAPEEQPIHLAPLPQTFWKEFPREQRLWLGGLAIAAMLMLLSCGWIVTKHTQRPLAQPTLEQQR